MLIDIDWWLQANNKWANGAMPIWYDLIWFNCDNSIRFDSIQLVQIGYSLVIQYLTE